MSSHHHHHNSNSHDHGHGHSHGSESAMGQAFWLNLGFATIEFFGGLYIQSFSVCSNALHDLGDCVLILITLGLEAKAKKKSDAQFSYGYRRYSAVAALISSLVLGLGALLVLFFSLQKVWNYYFSINSPSGNGGTSQNIGGILAHNNEMLILAGLGLFVNLLSLAKLRKLEALSAKTLSLHFIEDSLSWGLVFLGGLVLRFTGWEIIDLILGSFISCWLLFNLGKNLKHVVHIFLQATPLALSTSEIEAALCAFSEIGEVHHLHLWSLDGQMHVLTAHIRLKKEFTLELMPIVKAKIKELLFHQFSILESTIEFELDDETCSDPEHS